MSPIPENAPLNVHARTIVWAARSALYRASAPICYLHRDGNAPPFAVVVEAEYWQQLMGMIPEGTEITELVMNHGHVEGDEDPEP